MMVDVQCQDAALGLMEASSTASELAKLLEEGKRDEVFQLADSIIRNSQDPIEEGGAFFYKGLAEIDLLQLDLAHRSFDNSIQFFEESDHENGLISVHTQKGDLYYLQDMLEEANTQYSLSITYGKSQNLNSILSDLYQKKAEIYFDTNKSDSSFYSLKLALRYAHLGNEEDDCITIMNQLSTNYHAQGELDSAIHYFKENLRLKENIDDPDGLISDLSAIGNLYKEKGDYEEAQQSLMKALDVAEVQQDIFSSMTIYIELGDVYADQGIWNVAEDNYLKAIQLARSKESQFVEASGLRKLGYVLQRQGQKEKAIENYESALEIYLALNNRINTAEVMIILSKLYNRKDQFDKIKNLLVELLQTSDKKYDVLTMLKMKMALAEVEIKLNNYSKGLSLALECEKAFAEMGDKKGLQDVALILSETYSKRGEYRKAYDYHLVYNNLKDSLVNVERAEAIKKYALLATTRKKDAEISNQNEMLQKQQLSILKKNNQLLLMGGGLGIVGLLTVLILFIYRKNKQLDRQRIQVLEKERETGRLKAIIEGEEKERKRFARELHDGLGAVLATVKMQISNVGHHFPKIGASNSYQKAEVLIDDACRAVRDISHDLMPHVLEQQGLQAAIDNMCQNLSMHNDIEFDFIFFGEEAALSDAQNIALYRITQELLKNIIKHAEASEVIVQLTIEDDEAILIVEDDGKGFDLELKQNGIGIGNINSRTDYLDGTLDIDSMIGKGSTFTINLPLQKKSSNLGV